MKYSIQGSTKWSVDPLADGLIGSKLTVSQGLGGIMSRFKYLLLPIFFMLLLCSSTIFSQTKEYIKEYTYDASERDNKQEAREIALNQATKMVIEEIATYIQSELNVTTSEIEIDGRIDYKESVHHEIYSVTAGLISRKILSERWDGKTFYIRILVRIDPDEVRRSLDSIIENRQEERKTFDTGNSIYEMDKTIYYGGDWLTVIFNSLKLVGNRFLEASFTVYNPFDEEVTFWLYRPEANTYLVDNNGDSYDYMSSKDLGEKGNAHQLVRPGERVTFSVIFNGPTRRARYVTMRSDWRARGGRVSGTKEFVVKNVLLPSQ